MLRKIGKILKWLLILLAAVIILGIIINAICRLMAKPKLQDAYGREVSVAGKSMRVDVKGDANEPVIILLSGLSCASPVLELEPLADALSQNYCVVTVEPFGYGLSDGTDQDRTIENIVNELHTCVENLGYEEYYLMAHSIGGLYSLYWANQYPDEVKGFIGIDPSVPGMSEESPGDPRNAIYADTSYPYTEKELEVYRILSLDKAYNRTVMNEMKFLDANVETTRGMRFPDQVAVLAFVSGSNCELMSSWEPLHYAILPENGRGEVFRLEGSHYLHFEFLDQIVEYVINWIEQ